MGILTPDEMANLPRVSEPSIDWKRLALNLASEVRKALPRTPKMDGIASFTHEQKIIYRALNEFEAELDA